jgi:acyl carrier protein
LEPEFLSNLDSLDRVDLVMSLEKAFDTEVSDDEVEALRGFRTTQELFDYFRNRGKGGK